MTLNISTLYYIGVYIMNWYEKFKVGQKVRVVKKVNHWDGADWVTEMNQTMGKVYKIVQINKGVGYRLSTQIRVDFSRTLWDYYYPVESLACVKGEQLLFSFMR